jgi:hypothetical protein
MGKPIGQLEAALAGRVAMNAWARSQLVTVQRPLAKRGAQQQEGQAPSMALVPGGGQCAGEVFPDP